MPTHAHLTFDDRCLIQKHLTQGASFRQIARELDKDPSTIAKEIRRHLQYRRIGSYGKAFNDCLHRMECSAEHLCGNARCRRYCRFCQSHRCAALCGEYVLLQCPRLTRAPYVCNGCPKRSACTLEKRLYEARAAQAEYEATRSESRQGIALNEEEALRIDAIVSPLLQKGQSLHHILVTHADEIMLDERTLYRYVDQGVFSARNLDMPRVVRMGRRRQKKGGIKVDRRCREGRTYEHYLEFMAAHPGISLVEMDTVVGVMGGKVLLTIHFVGAQFMLAFLREANTSRSVIDIFNDLWEVLGPETFRRLFQVILTDNGSEFSNPLAIELSQTGEERTRIFYCDPGAPWQKGAAENNHTFLRRILPKGSSFDHLTQQAVRLVTDHVNCYARNNLGDQTPYAVFSSFFGEETLKKLGAGLISPDEITLLPTLIQ